MSSDARASNQSAPAPSPQSPVPLQLSGLPSPQSPDPLQLSGQQGHCIDCTLCVQVCPTGIDIRNGLQYECIACGACIDACDAVMDKVGTPRGLIRYTTQHALDGQPSRVLRPRMIVYAVLLGAICLGWVWGVLNRAPLIVDVLRDRNALYRIAADQAIENAYTVKLINKQRVAQSYRLSLENAGAVTIASAAATKIDVSAEQVAVIALTLRAAPGARPAIQPLRIVAESLSDPNVRAAAETRFFSPTP